VGVHEGAVDLRLKCAGVRRAAVLLLLVASRLAHADCPHDKTLPVALGSITVDGDLDDPTWQHACFAEDFEQKQPVYGAKPTHPVKVAVAIADGTLYIGARMWSAGPQDIDDALTQRDDTQQAERFIVSLDPSRTRRVAYSFAVTARGVRADWIHTDDNEGARDDSWNPVWRAKAHILADGWSAEMAIPLSQLRLPTKPATSWGINFDWYIPHRQEDVFWRAVPRDRTAWASYFGELVGVPPVHPGLGLELLPYVSTRVALDESPSGGFGERVRTGIEAGLDVKLRPLPGLTVSATFNPDFGQVDADPAFVNLTAYEVELPERRPFFVENNTLYGDSPARYFYSRRIGSLPRVLPDADEIDLPAQVRILGALAAGGYIAPRTQIATLAAVTDETSADAITAGARHSLVVAPLTGWSATRLEQQLGASVIGATATTVVRSLDGTGLESLLPSSAFAGGADAKLRTCDGEYELSMFAGATHVAGSAAAIALVETSAAHMFQRPDQSHVHVDPAAHHLNGAHGGIGVAKRSGVWQGEAAAGFESPGYELNDIGRLQSADDIDAAAGVRRFENTPGKHLFAWGTGLAANTEWNFGGLRRPVDVGAFLDLMSNSFHSVSFNIDVATPGIADDLTRGGPRMKIGWSSVANLFATTPNGRAFQLSGDINVQASETLDRGIFANATLSARVVPSVRLDLTPSFTIGGTRRQYVATVSDAGGGAETYGARYLFGDLSRKEAALELRATWSLSPDLVVTLYAQPFVSVGRYDRIGELVAAGSGDVRWYDSTSRSGDMRTILDGGTGFAIAEPDYSVTSLRSTAVLRWEPRPGSSIYVVWQQARGAGAAVSRPLHQAAPDLFTQPGVHTLAVKLAYWFG
jgi:hypothetical protein